MNAVTAYAAPAAKAPLALTTVPLRPVGDHDVLIEVRFCGICHTDVHQVRADWGNAIFPMVPGHEITGVVAAAGSATTRHAVGDRVGVGCFVDTCRTCTNCVAGQEQYCGDQVATYNAVDADGRPTYGGYSTHVVVDENYVVRIPPAIDLAEAAPLLCAGVSMYSPLVRWKVGVGTRVGIVGLGGLGHLGVRIAAAMGAEVTALSRGAGKRDDALRFGADHFHTTDTDRAFDELRGRLDLVVNTVSADLDLDRYLGVLDLDGTFVNVGVPERPLSFSAFALMVGRKRVAGSLMGSIRETQELLDFCAAHGFGAEIEVVPAEQINEALRRLSDGDVRYRFVVEAATIGSGQ
ncbi:NAD(P)-dependent alcohol dehydrogenase [Actinosynnema sp. ALI-1.44]|uniref:NAD(P)-dependent alcohol dehydrogenase n=1 Tax=Actinosynnema sp. ALI-1.44 TaxID=1933779 RepID=UPI001178BF87|nr:NAD(P)-dependent alcohol dehydrogenase [Actinosynnema sp. ALI-1.44]